MSGVTINATADMAMYGTTVETALHFDGGRLFIIERTYGPSGASMIRQVDVTEQIARALSASTRAETQDEHTVEVQG